MGPFFWILRSKTPYDGDEVLLFSGPRVCIQITFTGLDMVPSLKYKGSLKNKFPYFFSWHFVNRSTWNCREISFLSFWQHCKNYIAIASQKHMEHSIENGAAIACSRTLRGECGYSFFTAQNKSAVEIHREVCLCHRYISCKDIQLLYAEHTSLLNFNSWFVLDERKMDNCAHLARRNYAQWELHFNTALCTFLWSDCHVILTVLPETQKLYLPAILHCLVHKTSRKKVENLLLRRPP